MDEKLAILNDHLPKAILKALTPEAIGATPPTHIDGDRIACGPCVHAAAFAPIRP